MATMDIFNNSAFDSLELTGALEKVPFLPQRLKQLGLFTPKPIRTEKFSIEKREGALSLISASMRGEPLAQKERKVRDIRDFRTVRLAKGDVLQASELQNIRAFGKESELQAVQGEVMERLIALRNDLELTLEYHRLGAIKGVVLDADGTSTLYNWFTEWGVTPPTDIDFDLDNTNPASGAVRKKAQSVIRTIQRAAKGAWVPGRTYIHALCGDAFFDDLIAHPEVRQTYLNYAAAAELREQQPNIFPYGGIVWENYQGTDDNSTVAVHTDKAHFFPVNAPGVFEVAYSPAEFLPYVNTPGKPYYAMVLPDDKRQAFVEIEVYSYSMHYCTRPEMLQAAKRT